ncbi:hypothetical protein DASC09_020910 [Saccharomycopsis crataegensis]|uniref:Ubiquitin-like domain-containing protein n=1 Tax=Saccharomycopsis crataegensis TaxID=43959 RepID=A0AAV5QJA0_9ASCO|nr:hypothetical protein DASC09_020910 [Saccharomycopsis crataegensis]
MSLHYGQFFGSGNDPNIYVTLRGHNFGGHNGETVSIPYHYLSDWQDFVFCLSSYFPQSVIFQLNKYPWEAVTSHGHYRITPTNWHAFVGPGSNVVIRRDKVRFNDNQYRRNELSIMNNPMGIFFSPDGYPNMSTGMNRGMGAGMLMGSGMPMGYNRFPLERRRRLNGFAKWFVG